MNAHCGKDLETGSVPFQKTVKYQELCAEAARTSEAICSSVAFHINSDWLNRMTAVGLPNSPKTLAGLFLIWPLYAGSILSIVPKLHRIWTRRKFRSIGILMGLAQETVLADTVDLWDSTDPFKPLILSEGHVFMWIASIF